jgi:hypothetical protein
MPVASLHAAGVIPHPAGPLTSSPAGPFVRVTGTLSSDTTAVWRGHTGSMRRLLIVQILSHSWKVTFLEAP